MDLIVKECDTPKCKKIARDLREALKQVNPPVGESAQVIIFDPAHQGGPFVAVERRKAGQEHKCKPLEISFPIELTIEEIVKRIKECLETHAL